NDMARVLAKKVFRQFREVSGQVIDDASRKSFQHVQTLATHLTEALFRDLATYLPEALLRYQVANIVVEGIGLFLGRRFLVVFAWFLRRKDACQDQQYRGASE